MFSFNHSSSTFANVHRNLWRDGHVTLLNLNCFFFPNLWSGALRGSIMLSIYRIALTIQKNGSAQWESSANSQQCQVTASGVKYKSSFLLHMRNHFCHHVRNEQSSQMHRLIAAILIFVSLSDQFFPNRFYTAYE